MGKTGVLPAPRRHVMTGRKRDVIKLQRALLSSCFDQFPIMAAKRETWDGGQRHAALDRLAHARQRQLSVIENDGRNVWRHERLGIRRRRVTTDDDRYLRRDLADAPGKRRDLV